MRSLSHWSSLQAKKKEFSHSQKEFLYEYLIGPHDELNVSQNFLNNWLFYFKKRCRDRLYKN